MLDRLFQVKGSGSTYFREILGGAVTFMTMAYIITAQPTLMRIHAPNWAGQDDVFFSIMIATCLMSAFATLVMAFAANYPIALAPGMGINVLFAMVIGSGVASSPQAALGAIFIAGFIFLLISMFKIREKIIALISVSLKSAIAVGIGLFILVLGVLYAFPNPISGLPPADYSILRLDASFGFDGTIFLVFVINFAIIGVLYLLRVPGSLFLGMVAGAGVAAAFGLISVERLTAPIPSIAPTFLSIDIIGALTFSLLPYIAIFLFIDIFDTMGTLIGVAQKAGLLKPDGTLPRAKAALMSDAIGTVAGSLMGVSTVTSYIESSAGVAQGARTGLASVVTAILFLSAIFFTPLWAGFSSAVIIGPVLIAVGLLMMTELRKIDWADWTEVVPAVLTIVVMAGMKTIHDGLAAGFIAYPLCKLIGAKTKEITWLNWVMAVVSLGMVILVYTAM
ncbi:MAG TPA: NCS2 family permease [Acidobacteriota bacterium]|nr:NCS2 family permease [Acidobacteriota bacterium]